MSVVDRKVKRTGRGAARVCLTSLRGGIVSSTGGGVLGLLWLWL